MPETESDSRIARRSLSYLEDKYPLCHLLATVRHSFLLFRAMTSDIHSVLLIDDEVANNFIHRLILRKNNIGKDVHVFESAAEALEHLKSHDVDLILLDINMPGLSGWDFMDHLKPIFEHRSLPKIVILSSSIDPRDRTKAEAMPYVQCMLNKPLQVEQLKGVL